DAALIGNIFDFQTLKAIQTKPTSRAVLIRALLNAAATGYIIPLNFDIEKLTGESDEFYFKFAHDRIQQAAILLIPEEERLNRSLAIARYRKKLHKDQWSEKVFEIVPYYDQALPILLEIKRRDPDDLEIAIVAELNFMAACKSRLSVAYEEALLFARTAQILIHPKYWQKDFELTKDLYLQLAELEQINGEFKQAEKYFDECLKHFKKTEDIVDVYTKKVKLYTSSSEYQKAIAVGLKGLKMLGLRLKENPNMAKIGLNLLKVKSKLGLRKINSLLNLPEMKNEKALLAMKLMIETSTPAYQTDKNLVILIVLKMIMFSLKYGNNKDSGFAYMTYGILLSFGLNYPQGYEFGKLALDLNEKFKNIVLKPSLNEFFGSFICPWTHPLKEAIPYLKTAYQTGEETGDVYYAALAHCNHIGSLIYKGEYLNFTKENLLNFAKFIDKHKFKDTRLFFSLYKNFINFLISKDETYVFNEHKYSNENFFKEITKVKNENVLSNYYILKLMTLYYTQDFNNILHIAQKSEELIEYSRGLFQSTEHYFYYSLTITAMYQEFSKEDQAKYLKILKKNLSKFQAWNKHCAANFEAKLYLLQAELARLQGAKAQANLLYDQAIKSAKTHQLIQIEAIASECKASFYLNLENAELAQIFFLKAHSLYTQWGALAKAQQLESKYPEMFTELNAQKEEASQKLKEKEKEISKKMQELTGLTKTNQQISEALNLEKLLKILTPAIAQTAGADRTVVILKEQKEYLAVATYQDQNIQIITPQKIKDYAELPLNLLKKVMSDKEELMLNTPTETDDKYFATHQPRSVLILPILKESELKAIVYLENQVLRGSFQEDTISKLRILTNQASISLENALLYQDVKTLNQDLTQKIKKGVPEDDKFKAYLEELKQKAAYADVTRHIGHEIKNPMAFILGGVEMLEDETDPAKIHEYMVTLKEDIGRLLDLLDTMLEYGKPVQKKSENVDLNKMITQIHLLSRSDLGRNMIIFKLDLAPDLPEITVDKGQMRQAIINIITNAAQAIGQSGKVIIKTAQAKFKNNAKKTQKGLMIKIINTGPQITAEAKKHIFDTFYTTKDTGSGIGLSVVLNAVKTHNGMIDIESTKEETAFIIYLPLK
ncbi:GAF domain-containing protein, partial [bacterium]|nr:GAF domain-containing protein [bacterium]